VSDLVTGDAVVLELRLAKLPSRALAFAIDLMVMGLTYLLVLIGVLAGLPIDEMLKVAVLLTLFVAVFVGYPVTMETLTRGRTLGKIALGLRVVRTDGGPIRFRQALARGLAGLVVDFYGVSGFTGVIAVLTSLFSPSGRRVGDMLAGTIVVRERQPAHRTADLVMPPALAGWAESVELSQLCDALALRIRQFLGRVGEFDPAHRGSLGTDLAAQLAALVSPPPPPGTPVEAYLTAVLLIRRRREQARLTEQRPPDAEPPRLPEPPRPPAQDTAHDSFVMPR
jgi:uncharacterized RDD family membrane protein YckC